MSLAAAFVLIAQSAAPIAANAPAAGEAGAVRAPVAEQVRASVTVLRAERISAVLESDAAEQANAPAKRIQRSRDSAGTVWVEFS